MNYLLEILESQRERNVKRISTQALEQNVRDHPRDDMRSFVVGDSLGVIAEIKRRSPSKGELAKIECPDELAREYEAGGACMISVLTNELYFGARIDDLSRVRAAVTIPVLRKDFIVDRGDIFESYLMGADAVLLIVAAFDDQSLLRELHDLAIELGLTVLVETHSHDEIDRAHQIGASLIGVNIRSLETFHEDQKLGATLVSSIDSDACIVWESSIRSLDDAKKAKKSGADAVLVGQGLVQHTNPRHFISQMRSIV